MRPSPALAVGYPCALRIRFQNRSTEVLTVVFVPVVVVVGFGIAVAAVVAGVVIVFLCHRRGTKGSNHSFGASLQQDSLTRLFSGKLFRSLLVGSWHVAVHISGHF